MKAERETTTERVEKKEHATPEELQRCSLQEVAGEPCMTREDAERKWLELMETRPRVDHHRPQLQQPREVEQRVRAQRQAPDRDIRL